MILATTGLSSLSDTAREVDHAFYLIGVASAIMMAMIVLFVLYCIVKFRRSTTPTASQFHGNSVVEIICLIVPTTIVMWMFWVGFKPFHTMRTPPKDAKIIEVTGMQWNWSFYYPDYDVTDSKLTLKGGEPVKFLMRSKDNDVLHSLYLPDFRLKEDCMPGKTTTMWLQPDMPTTNERPTYNVFCAEFCGKDHAAMITTATILTPDEYDQWVAAKIADKNKPVVLDVAMNPESQDILDRKAETLYKTHCISCHGANGQGQIETAIPNARNFTTLADWKQGSKLTDIFNTLGSGVAGTQMASYSHLPAWDRFALMHYVASFYKGDRPEYTKEDLALIQEKWLNQQDGPKKTIPVDDAIEAMIQDAQVSKLN